MEHIGRAISKFSAKRYEEDFVDRLNFQTTTYIFMSASALISYKAYFGTPLQCWTPVQFRGGWDEYTNDYCFIENTYYTPVDNKSLPDDVRIRDNAKLPYYQWVPWVLALQAMMCCFPHVFWRILNWMSGLQVRALVSMATASASPTRKGVNEERLSMVVNHLQSGLKISRGRQRLGLNSNPFGFLLGPVQRHTRCYITFCYFTMKALFIANILIQLAVLNFFLDIPSGSSLTWGISLLGRLCSGNDWGDTGIFPRVTMCDFEIRVMGGNLHRWSVQCVLPVNMFNEKVYIVLWFWLNIMLIITVINTIFWFLRILSEERRNHFLTEMLVVAKVMDPEPFTNKNHEAVIDQMEEDLGWDGLLILRIILSNAGEFPCIAIIRQLYVRTAERLFDWPQKTNEPTTPSDFPKLVVTEM